MKVVAEVTVGDEVTEVRIAPVSMIAYEEEHGIALVEASRSDKLRWFYWITWHTLTAWHGEERSFDEWLVTVDDVEDITSRGKAQAGADPTGAAPAPGSADSPGSSSGPGSEAPKRSSRSRTTSKTQ